MSISGILRKLQGQGQVTKGQRYVRIVISRVTHVLWPNFDVELENNG